MQWEDLAEDLGKDLGEAPVPPPAARWSARLRGGGLRGSGLRAAGWLGAQLTAEQERWLLWLPVLMGTGIGVYFSLPAEPPPWLGVAALAVAVLWGLWRRGRDIALVAGGAALALGFAAAQLQTALVAAPVLEHRLNSVVIEGRLVSVDPLPEGARLVIAPSHIDKLAAAALPRLVRVRLRRGDPALMPGLRLRLKAALMPPPPPAMPGAYDFERRAYFDQLGAVGYAFGKAQLDPDAGGGSWLGTAVAALRTAVTARIRAALPGRSGGIAAALITGDTHAIPPADAQTFRDAGLAHILVIAGLHMGMVAGIVFFAVRALLALIPRIALYHPTKKWAAGAALGFSFGYMLLSGATVSSRRAFVMIGLGLLAVLVDRVSLSARAVACAAAIIMLMMPESVTGPSFQMSFAAVAALIAVYETLRPRLGAWHLHAGALRRFGLYLFGIALTTVVTTVATMPFTIYHFNRFPLFSVVANALAVPITGFWVMPCAILSCLLMPFHLEALALVPMRLGIEAILGVARLVTSWPGAVMQVPSQPAAALMLVALGGLWLCIWQRRWRLLGLGPVALGLLLALLARPPDVLVAGDFRVVVVRGPDGYLPSNLEDRRTIGAWAQRAAVQLGPAWPATGAAAAGMLNCDALACLYRARGQLVALERDGAALAEDCAAADLVVSPVAAHRLCRRRGLLDRNDGWHNGGYAIWLAPGGPRIESVRAWQGDRPWVPHRDDFVRKPLARSSRQTGSWVTRPDDNPLSPGAPK